MILEVQHETRLEYSEPVIESVTELRLEPGSDASQSCRSFHIAVRPATEVFRFQDGFGNCVHHFNTLSAHDEIRILAASVVETHPPLHDWSSSRATYPPDLESGGLELLDYLGFGGPVRPTPRLQAILNALRPRQGARVADFVLTVADYIHKHFEYARHITLATSPIDDVLEHGKGVCQDFTHLMIAVLRSYGVPARYASGYVHRPNKESQSHAWCEAWLPDLGWAGIDPTNNRIVDDHFVRVAIGRDFTDVPPNKGVYRGRGQEIMSVRVETRSLARLPSLSWQEQLPPLNVPLIPLPPRPRGEPRMYEESQQQ